MILESFFFEPFTVKNTNILQIRVCNWVDSNGNNNKILDNEPVVIFIDDVAFINNGDHYLILIDDLENFVSKSTPFDFIELRKWLIN